jgi:O-antigen/teichoic acid export membrane protein
MVFTQMSTTFLPVLVVHLLGPAEGAYLLPAQTIFAAMTLLSSAITSSLVVEGAKDTARAHRFALSVLRRIGATVLPAAVVLALAAPWVLDLFGPQYREHATLLLQLLMLATFPRVVVSLYVTKMRLDNRTGMLAVLQVVQAVAIVGGTAALLGPLGLVAVGWSALVTEVVLAIVVAPQVIRWLRATS